MRKKVPYFIVNCLLSREDVTIYNLLMKRQNSKGEQLNFLNLLSWNQLLDLEIRCERKHYVCFLPILGWLCPPQWLREYPTPIIPLAQLMLPARFAAKPRVRTGISPDPKHRHTWAAHWDPLGASLGVGLSPGILRDFLQKTVDFSCQETRA